MNGFQIVERVCSEATAVARVYIDSIRDVAELEDTTGVELYQGRLPGKARSMVAIKADKIQRARCESSFLAFLLVSVHVFQCQAWWHCKLNYLPRTGLPLPCLGHRAGSLSADSIPVVPWSPGTLLIVSEQNRCKLYPILRHSIVFTKML